MLAHVVFGIGWGVISRLLPVAIVPGANGLLGKIGSSLPEPPPSAAGLVHSTWTCFPLVPSDPLTRPNRLSAGGVWSNVENAITPPNCGSERHAGMGLKSPPASEPFLTSPF